MNYSDSPVAQVLAVEDNADLARLMQRVLQRSGIAVTLASSGEQAMELVKQRRFDLFVLNIRLPGISGLEVCRRLKLDPDLKAVPVIFASGETSHRVIDEAFRLGAVDYLPKPYGIEEFRMRVFAHLDVVPKQGVPVDALASDKQSVR